MKNYIARRFQTAQDSVMASAAAEKGAYSDLIDLSIGDTDFPPMNGSSVPPWRMPWPVTPTTPRLRATRS